MLIISHRGNIVGADKKRENNPKFIKELLSQNIDVEIDVWYKNGWYLGHDKPQYKIKFDFLQRPSLFCHAKNLAALQKMLENPCINCFWHQNDDFTLTSFGQIWTYPDKRVCKNSILVDLEGKTNKNCDIYGICTDFSLKYLNK